MGDFGYTGHACIFSQFPDEYDLVLMLIATHAAVGALVAQHSPHAFAAFIVGFLSHLLIDMIPHGDAHLYEQYQRREDSKHVRKALLKVSYDALAAVMIIAWVFAYVPIVSPKIIAWGIIGSILPDLLVGIYEVWKHPLLRWFHTLHFTFHNYFVIRRRDITLRRGLMLQVILLFFLIRGIW